MTKTRPLASITQADCATLRRLMAECEHVKKVHDEAKAHMDELETRLLAQLDAGGTVARGPLSLTVSSFARRVPRWKEVFIDRLGHAEAEKVTQSTPETRYRHLVVVTEWTWQGERVNGIQALADRRTP